MKLSYRKTLPPSIQGIWNRGCFSDITNTMNIRKWSATLCLLVALVLSALAQDGSTDTVFAPFPSRVRAAVKDNSIILSWLDSPDLKSGYLVYRSESPIDANTLSTAKRLGSITMGAQSYTDVPPDPKPYFYAVLAQSEDGSPYQVFIPAKNTTTTGISLPPPKAPIPVAAPVLQATAAPTPPAPAGPYVSGIEAKAKGDSIVISYKASPKSRLVLYRGSAPIVQAADLLDATLVAAFSDKNGSFADYPVPGVEYFYAILGEEDLKAGKINIAPGVNSLSTAVQVRASTVSAGFGETPPASRTPPLPYFLLENESIGSAALTLDEGLPPPRPVSPETSKAISILLAKTPPAKKVAPPVRVLPEESAAPAGGEDYALSLITGGKIASKDWAGAIDQLRKYLSLNRSPKAAARARFYLGEALVSTGSMQDAFFDFISARDFYPIETKPWIDYVLSVLAKD
jgi:hypothetical protein